MFSQMEGEEQSKKVVKWFADYVEQSGAKGVVIGNSGGKDSATVIAIATKALGKGRVVTVAIPCSSMPTDLEDAKLVANTFDVPLLEIDLTLQYQEIVNKIQEAIQKEQLGKEIKEETGINIRPRLRMTTLYAIAQNLGYLVAGTGNLCEAMVGYTTKWGDSASDFNPIAKFTVEEVLQIGELLGVPEKIIKKAPADGLGKRTDEEKLGFLYQEVSDYIRTGKTNQEALSKIQDKHTQTQHKRKPIEAYPYEGKNTFEEQK